MIGDTLLESSPGWETVLHGRHWLITLAAGAIGLFAGYFGLLPTAAPDTKVLIAQSVMLGVIVFCSALMLVYVHADSRHLGLRSWPWLALVLLLNVLGFIAYLVYSAAKTGNWKRATLPVAYMIEVMVIGVLVIIPLVYTEALPKAVLSFMSIAAPPPPPPPPAAVPLKAMAQRVSMADLTKEPTIIPKAIANLKERPIQPTSAGAAEVVPGGVPGGQPDGVIGSMGMAAAPPPPFPPKPQATERIRVGGQVEAAKLIYAPKPDYPQLAKMARIQGTVRLEALIAKDGTIKGLTVVSGHPLLVKAALQAVQQWRYQPTLLNGQPVEVETEIDVNFTLEG